MNLNCIITSFISSFTRDDVAYSTQYDAIIDELLKNNTIDNPAWEKFRQLGNIE